MMGTKIKKCCPNCSQYYQVKCGGQQKANLPLFLACGHSMCETCIRNIVKFEEPINCQICRRDMSISPGDLVHLAVDKSRLYDLFPVNMVMLGELTFHAMEQACKEQKTDESCYIDLLTLLKNTENNQGSCAECRIQTSKMCKQCGAVMCETCFTKTHKNFVIFKNHVLQNIEPIADTNNCKIHKVKSLDYYCKDCAKAICMDCLMVGGEKSCKNHDVASMQEVNDGFIEDLADIAPKVDETFRRLTKTAVDIGNLLHNIENESGNTTDLTQMLDSIEQNFSKISYVIQKHKNEVTDIIVKLKYSERESLKKAKLEIINAIKKAKRTLNTINACIDPEKGKQMNLAALLDEAKQIANSPWYLTRDVSNDPLKVAVNDDLCTLVSDYIHLDGNANSVYKLCTAADLGEGVEIPPPPPSVVFPPELPKDVRQQNQAKPDRGSKSQPPIFFKNMPKYRSKSNSVSSLNSMESDSSQKSSKPFYGDGFGYQKPVVQQVQPFPESQHPKQLYEGCQELIYITHIVDPHNFYVQRACHQGLVKEMLREFRNAVSLPKPSVSHVAEGKMYLVFNKADNIWQRGRIVSIDRRDIDRPVFQVFCFDFGSTEVVTIDKLRLLSQARSPYPLAIHCSLANVRPKTASWSTDDAYLIQNIVNNKQAVIHVRHIRSTSNVTVTLECDVTTFEDGISIAHALVFHERATMVNPRLPVPNTSMAAGNNVAMCYCDSFRYPKINCAQDNPKIFMSNNDFKPKAVEEVYITHIISPDKFYVRKRHVQNAYEQLSEDMDQEYSLGVNNGSIYLPEIGMACAVNVDKYRESIGNAIVGSWARGVVTELPGRSRVRVLLADCGVSALVHWATLRKLHKRHATHHAAATECHLAGVTPLNKKWSRGSVALLEKFEERLLELHVEDMRRGSVGVTLYDKADEDNIICINTEMIRHKFAVTFGLFQFNQRPAVEEQVITNKSPLDIEKPRPKPKENEIKILKKSPVKKIKEKELEAKDKGPLRLEAKVLHYQSPSLFYVSLVHQQKAFNELYEKMQKYYSKNNKTSEKEWAVGDRCCTLCNQSQTWRRATIVEVQEGNAKVFFSDFACSETVPLTSLRELTPEFGSVGDAAIKCHMCGVTSADGGEEWPTITKEYLKELLDAYPRIFITKLGNFKEKSMPVEVWVYHTIQGGALEPNKSEWRCLNKKIIEQGLGVPDKNMPISALDNNNTDDKMLSFLDNVKGSVNDWLLLEPLPTKPLDAKPAPSPPRSPPAPADRALLDAAEAGPSNTEFITDWLPPEPLTNKEFTGMPTYIDNDGVLYLHDVCQQETLAMIRTALNKLFRNPDPKAKYTKWVVGEPCVAMFFLDSQFYRGRVLEVNEDTSTCIIHYIDYGNEEACSFENLRKSIPLYQIPTQAHKCILNRIKPKGGQWDRLTLDYIHKSVVEKECYIKITGEPIDGITPIDLKYNKLWINDHLVDFEMAEYTDGSKPIVRKFVPPKAEPSRVVEEAAVESDSGPDYIVEDENDTSQESFDFSKMNDWNKMIQEEEENSLIGKYATFPKNNLREFPCNITIINNLNTLELSMIHNDEDNLLYEEMYDAIQKKAEDMPPLNGVYKNKACIALFHEDGLWYRSSVLEYSESDHRIKVRYVDYGNVEVVSLADVREIDDDWSLLPPATIQATLHGVKLNPNVDPKQVLQEYGNTFLDKGPFNAKVIIEGEVPSVELLNDGGELVYGSLISSGVLLQDEDIDD